MTAAWEVNRDAHLALRDKELQWGRDLLKEQAELLKGVDVGQVLSVGAAGLSEKLYSTKNWSAKSVLLVYISQALRAHAKSNLLTEVMFKAAWDRASQLDDDFNETKEKKGRLHGCPISIKDHLDVKGVDTTVGFTYKHGVPAEQDAPLVSALIEAGANPFVKTNIPQTMLSFECANPLFGVTTNPHDSTRTPGGSSGGEAALLASDASSLGIGSDIGGSLRIPAHYSGCYGLKPTIGRTPTHGIHGANPGFEAIAVSCGPMGRSVADLEVGMRCLVDHSAKYTKIEGMIPLPWRELDMPKKLKFGYYQHGEFSMKVERVPMSEPFANALKRGSCRPDGVVRNSPACARALQMSIDALRKKGHEVVEIPAPDVVRGLELFIALTSAGNYETLLGSVRDDPREGFLWLLDAPLKYPRWFRNVVAGGIERFMGDQVFPRIIRALGRRTVTETQAWAHERQVYAYEVRRQLFETHGLDGLLTAPQATPALKCETTWDISTIAVSTFLWNVVDSTAGVLPVTFVDPEKDALTPEFMDLLRTDPGSQLIEGRLYGPKAARYNSKEMEGVPVGVQIIAAKYEEEKVIKMMAILDEALGPRGFGPGDFFKREQKKA